MSATSVHFSDDELRCKCTCQENKCTTELVNALEALRSEIGLPIGINDAYRCAEHNKAVGGAPDSEHLRGNAADIHVAGLTARQLEAAARKIPAIKGIGRGDALKYVHIDVRQQPAQWTYDAEGRTGLYYA